MEISGKLCVVTGGAGGIGRALATRFLATGARTVVIVDRDAETVRAAAAETGAEGIACDVTREADLANLIERVQAMHGEIDVFCSNAGVFRLGGEDAPDAEWLESWNVHVMAHVYAARLLAPRMAARGEGYLVNTASAAGVLTHVDSATYSVTKHAAVAFAEWLAITYGEAGVKVSVLCPQAVRTQMIAGREGEAASVDGIMEPDTLADAVVGAMTREEFFILPHPEVAEYMQRKARDPERWLAGMRRFRARIKHREG
jgi:NAD(P)-dependent dehydrogenase (short-subunit alcohol dehydrogenase family)